MNCRLFRSDSLIVSSSEIVHFAAMTRWIWCAGLTSAQSITIRFQCSRNTRTWSLRSRLRLRKLVREFLLLRLLCACLFLANLVRYLDLSPFVADELLELMHL